MGSYLPNGAFMKQYRDWLALKQIAGIGNVLYKRLIETFKTPEAVFSADKKRLLSVEGISEDVIKAIHDFKDFNEVDRELEAIAKEGIRLLPLTDPDYPPLLLAIYDPPPLLYVKGDIGVLDTYPIAVVGTRKNTPYGRSVAEKISRGLAERGVTIVSGFARGIDGIAHRAAIAAGGKTIAVMGSGIDQIYPPEHRRLFIEITQNGAILSEFPMGTGPEAHHFPQRNRIISGLSLGCVVVEAAKGSGSLITARLALEQGREVFAVPGPIFSETSAGPHQLIGSGAKLTTSVDDILEEIQPPQEISPTKTATLTLEGPTLEGDEAILYQMLSWEPKHIDQVIEEGHWPAATVSGILLSLELKGRVRQLPGQFFVRI